MKLVAINKNQNLVELRGGVVILFSYQTPVAGFSPDIGYFRTEEFHSTTTSRHINNWLEREDAEHVETVPQEQLDEVMSLVD